MLEVLRPYLPRPEPRPLSAFARVLGCPPPPVDPRVDHVAEDSRQVRPGSLFVAVPGFRVDGHAFLAEAQARGAVAAVVQADRPLPSLSIPVLVVEDSRRALSRVAAFWWGEPSWRLRVIGVTGTDGKSTTVSLIQQLLQGVGLEAGSFGTVEIRMGRRRWLNPVHQTTPSALEVQGILAAFAARGLRYAVVESSSHGLALDRLADVAYDVAVLTNVTRDHLELHGTEEAYRQAKARLFRMLRASPSPLRPFPPEDRPEGGSGTSGGKGRPEGGRTAPKGRKLAVVNADDPHHGLFLDAAPPEALKLRYGLSPEAQVRASAVEEGPEGIRFRIWTPSEGGRGTLPLRGRFNVHNALAALAVAWGEGVRLEEVLPVLARVEPVRGRMEPVEAGQPFQVLIDYAHTPAAFERLFALLRPTVSGRILAVFGSAGERDRGKRPLLGEVAGRACDLVFLTEEDPRGEDPQAILEEIAVGAEGAGKVRGRDLFLIPDRREAIRAAFRAARAGDLVLLLGKGHETTIERADGPLPWDEAAEARRALEEMGWKGGTS